MLKVMGADMVGMSTACEAIAANHAGLKIAALSCITNYAAGISQQSLNHQEVQDTAKTAMEKFKKILNLLVEDISQC
jgi:purine-nucleoside phosphorylase